MADTGSRTLRLLSLIQTRRHWSGTDLADRLGVSLRTVRRDIERLCDLGYPVELQVLTVVASARRDTERLTFGYTAAGGARSERHVEPFRLVALGRRWYVVAYDVGRGDWRSFRLDRLTVPRGTGARFAPRQLPAGDAVAFVRVGIADAPAPVAVRARIGRWATVEECPEGRCRVRMKADDLSWPALALGTTGAEFVVVSPPGLSDLLRDWGARFTRAAAGTTAPA
jgi:predicted DNA-binding transcriptional regulator YafY